MLSIVVFQLDILRFRPRLLGCLVGENFLDLEQSLVWTGKLDRARAEPLGLVRRAKNGIKFPSLEIAAVDLDIV